MEPQPETAPALVCGAALSATAEELAAALGHTEIAAILQKHNE